MPLLHDDLVGLTAAIWESVLDMEVMPVPPELVAPALTGQPTFTACIGITGGWEGSVAIVLPVGLASKLASGMFAMNEDELDPDLVRDAIGELVNIAGGNVKGMIPDACDLGLPIVAEGTSYTVSMPGTHVVCEAAFDCAGEPFTVTLKSNTPFPIQEP